MTEEKKKKIEMRELQGDDLFTLFSIIGKLDIKDEFIGMFSGDDKVKQIEFLEHKGKKPTKAEQEAIEEANRLRAIEADKLAVRMGANAMQKVLVNAKYLKADLNNLLADLVDEDIEFIETLNLVDYTKLIVDFFKKKELKDFFSSIATLMQ